MKAVRFVSSKKNVLPLVLLVIVLIPVSNILFTSDSMGYVRKGAEFAGSLKYTDASRGPGMPAITAIGIWLLGA